MKSGILVIVVYVVLVGAALLGWCKCVYKAVNCNWEPIGKAEVIYTVGCFTGVGIIIGYIDIEDK